MAFLKKLGGFVLMLLSVSTLAGNPQQNLLLADSLFLQKKYTQAFQSYQALEQQGLRSPAMLLRMAFIQEGLGQTAQSLLYLNRYLALSGDRHVVEKIRDVATKKNLSGYDFTATEQARLWLSHHLVPLAASGGALLILLVIAVSRTRPRQPLRWLLLAATMVTALVVGVALIEAEPVSFGISRNPVYLMEGPSAGAPVVARIGAGHRLPVSGGVDVWQKTTWQRRTAFVRRSNIDLIY